MSIHVENNIATIRYYKNGKSFNNMDPYSAVATLQFFGDTTCYISGLHGEVDRTFVLELSKKLADLGISTVLSHRHGRIKYYDVNRYLRIFSKQYADGREV